jgi:WD40 repeat protein
MATQQTVAVLEGHYSSVKQVRFQPGQGNNILATSSRDGTVHLWDLRIKGSTAMVQTIEKGLDPDISARPTMGQVERSLSAGTAMNSIYEAHAERNTAKRTVSSTDSSSRTEVPGRRGDVSITALQFLPGSQSHFLLTASESNACIKLWDLRQTHTARKGPAAPLSSTPTPTFHSGYRNFGLNSLTLNGDGTRLYSLCRDNTVYAYSTAHLVLGFAPELSSLASSRPRRGAGEKSGLGPIYGFRHPQLQATSFYVKTALRPASYSNGQTEMLAVGSSDGCPILFPTDESYLEKQYYSSTLSTQRAGSDGEARQPVTRSFSGLSSRIGDTIPIYTHGTSLIRGHSKEVTGLTWTQGGDLVSVGDDFTARCWREGARGIEARDMRIGGESDGRRWGWGWADVHGWDDE